MGLLRTLLATAVLLVHTGGFFRYSIMGGGQAPVQIFYLISGFYMALVLSETYAGAPLAFYRNRLLRLLPTYWVVAAGAILVYLLLDRLAGTGAFAALAAGDASALMLAWAAVSNAVLVGIDGLAFVGMVYGSGPPLVIGPAWTLGLELAFYALAPFVVRRPLPVLLALFAASLALRIGAWAWLGLAADPWSYRFFPFELAFFLAGALAYRLYRRIAEDDHGTWLGWSLIPAVLVFQPAQKLVTLALPGNGYALVAFWAMFYCCAAAAIPYLFRASRRSALDAGIGALSYPLYLVHFPLDDLYRGLIDGGEGTGARALRSVAVLALSLALAYLLARFLERPIDRRRHAAWAASRAEITTWRRA